MAGPARQQSDEEDRIDILAFQRGQRRAFDSLYQRHERPSYAFVLRRIASEADATDVWQKAWIKIARNLVNWRPTEPFRSYLYAALRTGIVDYYRVNKRRPPMEVVNADGSSVLDRLPGPEQVHGDPFLRQALTNALMQLESRERALLIGVLHEGAPQAEMERQLSLTRRQGIKLMRRAKDKAAAWLRARKVEPV